MSAPRLRDLRGEDYAATLRALYALAGRGIVPGLERMRASLSPRALALPVVHIAGTNGKGSVCSMIAAGVRGARVGLYTSPHLSRLTERVRIDGAEVEPRAIVEAFAALPPDHALTFFEAITVMALELFAARGVELAVLETGLGGRLDATNVYEAPLCTAITRIGLDHQQYLGDDLASIAREKAGILRPGVPVVIGRQVPEARDALEAAAAEIGAPVVHVDLGPDGALRGAHQRENTAIALGVLEVLAARGFAVDEQSALHRVRWPGRLEALTIGGTSFLLDGAHNLDGCEALARHLAGEPPRVLVFGAMSDKAWAPMLSLLARVTGPRVYTAPALTRAEAPARLAAHLPGAVAQDLDEALALARRAGDRVVIAGSLYLVGAARARLLGEDADPPIAM